MSKSVFLLTLLFSAGLVVPASSQVRTDSLEQRLEVVTGLDRAQTLVALAEAGQRNNPPKTIGYAREALRLLSQYPDHPLRLQALHEKGRAHVMISEFDSALAAGDTMQQLARAVNDRRGEGDALNLKGTARSLQGDLSAAHQLFTSALRIREEIQDARGVANTLSNLGIVEMRQGDFDASLDFYMRSLAAWESIGDESGLARVLTNIGNVHFDYENRDDALEFYRRALGIREREGDRRGIAVLQNNIGLVHADGGDFERALASYSVALQIWEEIGDRGNRARVLGNMGLAHAGLARFEEALSASQQALAIRESIGDRRGTAITLSSIGNIERRLGRPADALESLRRALPIAQEVGDRKLLQDIHHNLSTVLEETGDMGAALDAYKRYSAYHDSLFNEESQETIAELQTRYQTNEQRQRIALLEQEREIEQLWRNVLIGGVLVLVIVVSLVYSRYQLKNQAHRALEQAHADLKAAQAQLVQAEKLASLGQLTAGIAHHIKNPLNFVNNFAEVSRDIMRELSEHLSEAGVEDPEIKMLAEDLKGNMETIVEQGRRADSIVKGMMEHATGIAGTRQPTDLNRLVEDFVDLAYEAMKARHAEFTCEISRDYDPSITSVNLIPQEIGRVVANVASNAFESMYEGLQAGEPAPAPSLYVQTERVGEQLILRIRDNGPGVPLEIRDKIFEPFFTTKPTGTGTGLGLSLSHDIVTAGHGGRMSLLSEDRGAMFVIELPVGLDV